MKKQADGRYRTKVIVGRTADGLPVIKWASGRTKKDLEAAVDELKRVHGAGGPGALANILFAEYARRWLEGKSADLTENSLSTYTGYVENHIIPAFGKMQMRSILPSDIKAKFAKMTDIEPNTRRAVLARMKSIMDQAQEDNIRPDNPAKKIKLIADLEPKRRALNEEEIKAVQSYISAHPGTDGAKMLGIIYYTNCRRGECFGPQWKHFDFKRRVVTVKQQLIFKKGGGIITPRLKTKNSYREMPMPAQLYDILYPLRGIPGTYVFQVNGRHYKPSEIDKLWDSIVEEYPVLAAVSPHYFRHNYATRMYKKGVPVKEAAMLMGETVKVMLETYVHIEKELGVDTNAKIYDIFSEVAK